MNSIKNIKTVIFFILLSAAFLQAQSLDSLINEGVRNNPQLKSLNYKIKASEHNAKSVGTMPAPSLNIEFNSLSFSKPNIWNDALSQSFSISQMIPLGGKLGAMENMANSETAIASSEYDSYKITLISKIKMSYYTVWQIEKNIEIQKKYIDLLNSLLKTNETLYQSNKLSRGEILMLQSEIANYETQLVVLKNKKEIEISNLNKLIGRDVISGNITVDNDIYKKSTSLNEREIIEDIKLINPSLIKMNRMILMNEAAITANEKEMIPDLMIGGMLMRMPQGMIVTTKSDPMMIGMGGTEVMYGLMASITLPFAPWARGKIDERTLQLESNIKSVESEKLDMERDMIQKAHELLLKLKNTDELISLYNDKVLPLERDYLEMQKSSFLNNNTSLNTVLEANKMLLMNEMNLYMAKADYQMALADLEMMTGKQFFN